MKIFLKLFVFSSLLFISQALAQDEAFSFAESMAQLSTYEETIAKVGRLEPNESDNIRLALNDIRDQAEKQLTRLDTDIQQKQERLTTLLEKPDTSNDDAVLSDSDKPTPAKPEIEDDIAIDPVLLRNKEALEIDLVSLETMRKKASLVSVYATDLISQLATQASEQTQRELLYRAPSLFSLDNWKAAFQSFSPAANILSTVRYAAIVGGLGFLLIFGIGPFLFRSFKQHYSNLLPVENFPAISFFAIFMLVLFANCFYFEFVTQERHLELAFLALLVLNLALAFLLIKRISHIRFSSQERIVDGEGIVKERQWLTFSVSVLKLLTVLAAIASFLGYTVLSMYVLHNIVITLTAAGLFLSLRGMWISSERTLLKRHAENDSDQAGEQSEGSLFLLTLVELALAIGLFLTAARFWGVSLNNFEGQSNLMRGQLQIGSLTIGFNQLISSVIAFLLVFYFFKLIRWFLRERVFKVMRLTLSSSEAVLAIFGYMGFTLAIVASLNSLGVQWENLAIIAGALSVGIGFGLQTIISNFVSGLILLFERPVRVGDWVILGNGLEGHIKKINMRSTEIMTLERSSVLIPNSNLLSDTITNWTLHDKIGRQDIPVGVAYGSDTEHVKKVLLEVAAGHNLLRRYPQPTVLFRDFGDSSLDFFLRVFLRNIDDRHRVGSELRFEIDRAFRENNISIPFPQRDLHVKEGGIKASVKPEPVVDKDDAVS